MPGRTTIGAATVVLIVLFAIGCATPTGVDLQTHDRDEPRFGPWSTTTTSPTVQTAEHRGSRSSTGPNDGLVDFVFSAYSNHLTRIDGARCEHRPTCSYYAYLAIKEHGYVVGTFLTVDRLLRGSRSSTLRRLDVYKIEAGTRYYYDPVENNDFFF